MQNDFATKIKFKKVLFKAKNFVKFKKHFLQTRHKVLVHIPKQNPYMSSHIPMLASQNPYMPSHIPMLTSQNPNMPSHIPMLASQMPKKASHATNQKLFTSICLPKKLVIKKLSSQPRINDNSSG